MWNCLTTTPHVKSKNKRFPLLWHQNINNYKYSSFSCLAIFINKYFKNKQKHEKRLIPFFSLNCNSFSD